MVTISEYYNQLKFYSERERACADLAEQVSNQRNLPFSQAIKKGHCSLQWPFHFEDA
jgi:hypothetical protein